MAFTTSRKKALTLAQIADATGVSTPTVSKVVNGRPDVSEETRAKVLAALDASGYQRPSRRHATSTKSPRVEVITDALTPAYSAPILTGILDSAASNGIEVSLRVGRTQDFEVSQKWWTHHRIAERWLGLILLTSVVSEAHLSALRGYQIPVAVIDPPYSPPSDIISVGATNWAGAKAGVEHLMKLGHRDIAYVGGLQSTEYNQARFHGYLAALDAAGARVNHDYVLHGPAAAPQGVNSLRHLLSLPHRPTAVFTGSDSIAVGMVQEARHHDISIPEDLSLVSFGGTIASRNCVPPLTSVSQPLHEMGRAALRAIYSQARGEEGLRQAELGTQLVVRQSTASIPTMTLGQAL